VDASTAARFFGGSFRANQENLRQNLQPYYDEICFRFNNRKNLYLFRDTILKLIASPNLEYKRLTQAA
jgi:hypothetical protein